MYMRAHTDLPDCNRLAGSELDEQPWLDCVAQACSVEVHVKRCKCWLLLHIAFRRAAYPFWRDRVLPM